MLATGNGAMTGAATGTAVGTGATTGAGDKPAEQAVTTPRIAALTNPTPILCSPEPRLTMI